MWYNNIGEVLFLGQNASEKGAVMFKQGDVVSYGATGVCRISGECIQKVKGENRRYLTLKPVYSPNSTVYVPIDNEVLLGKVKNLMTDDDAKALIQELPLSETDWIENDAKRTESFTKIIEGGNRKELAEMVRALYVHRREQLSKGKRLHASDELFFRNAEKILFEELAAALGIEPDQVLDFIENMDKKEA